jgi:hypothetical protein
MDYTIKVALVFAFVLLVTLVVYNSKSNECSSRLYENFTPASPPTPGTSIIPSINTLVLPTVAESAIGGSDRPITDLALNSTQSSVGAVMPLEPASIEFLVGSDYDSMFDTKLAPAWSTNASVSQLDGKLISQPPMQSFLSKISNINPASTLVKCNTAPTKPGLARLDARGMAPFTNLIEMTQRNYLTAQNFWEYNYAYPLVPSEGSAPLGSSYTESDQYQNPLVETRIISANKDGGQPLPHNTFFRPT